MKAAALICASLLLLCCCSRLDESYIAAQVGENIPQSHSKLADLPPRLQSFLLEQFDSTAELRKALPNIPVPMEREIITDERRWFAPACMRSHGYSGILFVRAIEVGHHWVIHYEMGGIVHGAALLVVSRDTTGAFHQLDNISLRRLKPSTDEVIAALKRSTKKS